MKKAYLNWSSGKDAAYALYKIKQAGDYDIQSLVTTVNTEFDRVSMHGVRKELLQLQAHSLGLPLHIIGLDGNLGMKDYNRVMQSETKKLMDKGFTQSVFGDIFLEDLKTYREAQLSKMDIKAVFPLWKLDTAHLIKDFIAAGFKAIVVCVNAKFLDESFCGRIIDQQFLNDLPEGVDSCGENGEFHSFVFDGPIFENPIKFKVGEIVKRTYKANKDKDDCFTDKDKDWDTSFWYCDLLPENLPV